jgi:hypothetical protein
MTEMLIETTVTLAELPDAQGASVMAYIDAIAARLPAERRQAESDRLGERFAMLYQRVSTGDLRRSGADAVRSALRML